jgi:glucan-binding YG repeat protein
MLTGWQQLDNNYWFFFHDTKGSSLEGAMYVSDKDGRQFIATF